jgi:hypothetical protein
LVLKLIFSIAERSDLGLVELPSIEEERGSIDLYKDLDMSTAFVALALHSEFSAELLFEVLWQS